MAKLGRDVQSFHVSGAGRATSTRDSDFRDWALAKTEALDPKPSSVCLVGVRA